MDSATAMMAMMTYGFEFVLMAAISILTIVGMWKIMVKAGYNGWESLIPFYNRYILLKLSGKKKLWIWYLILNIVMILCVVAFTAAFMGPLFAAALNGTTPEFFGQSDEEIIFGFLGGVMIYCLISSVISIGLLVINILMCLGITESFGINGGYAVGLIFLPYVFYPIIGFSKNIHYICPGGNKNQNYTNQNYANQNYAYQNNMNQNYGGQNTYSQNTYGQYDQNQNGGWGNGQ